MLLRRRQRVLPVFRNYRFFAVEANLDHENVAQIPTNEQTITVAPPVKPTTSMLATQRQQFLEKQRHTPTVTVRTPILIVGASPAGATLSALLGSMHIPHLLVDRTPSLDALKLRPSQEHVLSRRSLEIFRALERLDDRLEHPLHDTPVFRYRYSSYGTSLDITSRWHSLLALHDHYGIHDNVIASPNSVVHIPEQHLTHKVLSWCVEKNWLSETPLFETDKSSSILSANAPSGQLCFGTEWVGGTSGCLENESLLYNARRNEFVVCKSGLIVGADGNKSSIRQQLLESEGARMERLGRRNWSPPLPVYQGLQRQRTYGLSSQRLTTMPAASEALVQVNFQSQKLAELHKRVAPQVRRHTIYNRDGVTQLFVQAAEAGLYAAQFLFFPDHQSFAQQFHPSALVGRLQRIAGRRLNDIDFTVNMNGIRCCHPLGSTLASRFRDVTTGRVLIIGNAAHSLVSADGGLELNCSIADAANLAWKLALIYNTKRHRYADSNYLCGSPIDLKSSRILDSYAAERYYTAQYYGDIADKTLREQCEFLPSFGKNWERLLRLSQAILTAEAHVPIVARSVWFPLRRFTDAAFRSAFFLLFRILMPARKLLPLYWMRLQRNCQATINAPFHDAVLHAEYRGADLHYAYRNSPLHPQVKNGIPYIRAPKKPTSDTPSTILGCRVPHVFILAQDIASHHILLASTIDLPLLTPERHRFCLLMWDCELYAVLVNAVARQLSEAPDQNPNSSKAQHTDAAETYYQEARCLLAQHFFPVVWSCQAASENARSKQHAAAPLPTDTELSATSVAAKKGLDAVATQFHRVKTNSAVSLPSWPNSSDRTLCHHTKSDLALRMTQTDATAVASYSTFTDTSSGRWVSAFSSPGPFLTGSVNAPTRQSPSAHLRYVWSDKETAGAFKDAVNISSRLAESYVLLRPDSHVVSVCDGRHGLDSFVKELLLLPLTSSNES